jgi:nucleoside-diphosphate-sugar epimerase
LSASLPPVIYGNGNQTRDFIFVDDVVVFVSAIVLTAAGADKKKLATKADLEFEF